MRIGVNFSCSDVKLEISQCFGNDNFSVSASIFAEADKNEKIRSGLNFGMDIHGVGGSLRKYFDSNSWDRSAYALYNFGKIGKCGFIWFDSWNESLERCIGGGLKWTHYNGHNAIWSSCNIYNSEFINLSITANLFAAKCGLKLNWNFNYSECMNGPLEGYQKNGGGFGFSYGL